jgi:hypothetical protein
MCRIDHLHLKIVMTFIDLAIELLAKVHATA